MIITYGLIAILALAALALLLLVARAIRCRREIKKLRKTVFKLSGEEDAAAGEHYDRTG